MSGDTIIVAIVVSLISPLIVSYFNSRSFTKQKKLDWDREDEIEKRKRNQAEEAARLLLAANERVAATAKITNNKLDRIHTLVNSNLTASMQAELDATVRELVMMKEVVALNKEAGREPSSDALGAISFTENKISELSVIISDRLNQTEATEHQSLESGKE